MNRTVIIGGFATSEQGLTPIASAVERLGIANHVEVFPFLSAMKRPGEVRKATENALVITHSAGVLALEASTSFGELVACNGPEAHPKGARGLIRASLTKRQATRRIARNIEHPFAAAYRAINRDNKREGARHLWGYTRRIAAVAHFSTAAHLTAATESGEVQATALVTPDDEFFPYVAGALDYGNAAVLMHEGNHDALLANPEGVLSMWLEHKNSQ